MACSCFGFRQHTRRTLHIVHSVCRCLIWVLSVSLVLQVGHLGTGCTHCTLHFWLIMCRSHSRTSLHTLENNHRCKLRQPWPACGFAITIVAVVSKTGCALACTALTCILGRYCSGLLGRGCGKGSDWGMLKGIQLGPQGSQLLPLLGAPQGCLLSC